jgi:transcriptional regulator with XRE-family HTH domain
MNTADRIQNLRKTKGISQEELADKIGVSRQAVSKWESEQNLPDIDKVIIMSDFFEVTTDYILKGIENEKQVAEKHLSATVFVFFTTALNFIGLIVSGAVWYEKQVPMALVIGLIFMVAGCMTFGVGYSFSTKDKVKAKRRFWTINVWILTFLPLSGIYNVIFAHSLAPYPLFWGADKNLIVFPAFWLVYIATCLAVVLTNVRIERRK